MTKHDLNNIILNGESETVEFKLSFNKTVIETLVAFSNTKGGKVIIGVKNDKTIVGVTISEETVQKWVNEIKQNTEPAIIPDVDIIEIDNQVVILSVVEYPIKPVNFRNKYYKRVSNSNHIMSLTEVANKHLQTINSSWDYYPDPNHNFEHISFEKVEKYIKEYEKWNDTTVDYGAVHFLEKQEFIRNGKLTFGAYILFARDICVVSDLQLGRFKSPTKIIDNLNLDTDIFTELDEILAFIKKHLMVEFIITGNAQREERYDYPLDAIREIVINMLVHRDYRESSGSIVKIYDDRIEFYNPGSLFGGLTYDDLLKFNYQPQARNKMLAKAFKLIGKVEKYGSGIKRIHTICKNYGIIPPKINIKETGFEVVLFKEKLNDELNDELNEGQKKVLNFIKNNKNKMAKDISEQLNMPFGTVDRHIRFLLKQKLIIRKGSKKTGGYYAL